MSDITTFSQTFFIFACVSCFRVLVYSRSIAFVCKDIKNRTPLDTLRKWVILPNGIKNEAQSGHAERCNQKSCQRGVGEAELYHIGSLGNEAKSNCQIFQKDQMVFLNKFGADMTKNQTSNTSAYHPLLLDMEHVCALVSFRPAWIYRMLAAGKFPQPHKIGDRAVRWTETQIKEWVEAQTSK